MLVLKSFEIVWMFRFCFKDYHAKPLLFVRITLLVVGDFLQFQAVNKKNVFMKTSKGLHR